MPSITKATAKLYCRTCLIKINVESECDDPHQDESKDICINILKNKELEILIRKYINTEKSIRREDKYPQCICLSCYNKLTQTDKFLEQAKLSDEKLFALFDNDESGQNDESTHDINIYKLLLKDTLMETESVLLENESTPSNINTEINYPDPFGPNPEKQLNRIKTSVESSETSDNSGDDFEWEQNSLNSISSSEQQNIKRTTRSNSKILKTTPFSNVKKSNDDSSHLPHSEQHSNVSSVNKESSNYQRNENIDKDNPTSLKRKKRRTKKEMEEHHHKPAEKRECKSRRRQKGSKNTFKCTQCNHSFAHKITLDAHIRKIHQGSKRPFQCDRCEKSYTFIGGLYTHIKEIHEAEVRSYACDFANCDRIYTSFIAMQKHKRLKHTNETGEQKKYVCEQCGATFNQTGNLRYHRRMKHPTEAEMAEKEREKERFECLICKKLFHSRYTLKYHTLQLHTNETKYECNVCGRRMAKKFMLVQHMLVHSTEKMPCEHCGKQFIRKFELEAHIRAVHMKLKPFECQYCSECFASRKTLRHHEFIHTGEKPYVCDLCGQAYRQQTCLKNHRKLHEKPRTEVHLSTNINQSLMNTKEENVPSIIDGRLATTTVIT